MAPNCNQFFVFLSQPHSSLTLSSSFALPRGLSHFIRSPLSAPFLLVPFWTDPWLAWAPCFVRSFAHSFRMAGWRYPVQPEFASRIPLFAFQFHETLATAPLPPPPLPNGGYKHKYEFKGPQMTVSRITSPTIPCILIRSGYPPRRSPTISYHPPYLRYPPQDFRILRIESNPRSWLFSLPPLSSSLSFPARDLYLWHAKRCMRADIEDRDVD